MPMREALCLPNLLTYGRILAVPVIAALISLDSPTMALLAFVLYCAACLTDYLDGVLARLLNQGTDLGRMLDPIADKLLVAAILVMLVANQTLTGWSLAGVLIIFCREFAISGLREFLGPRDVVIHVSKLAKWKTTTQLIALGVLILAPLVDIAYFVGLVLFWIACLLTLVTGIDYLRQGLQSLDPSSSPSPGGKSR